MTAETSAAPKSVRVHLGVHKTATSHLQQRLDALAPHFEEQGLAFIPFRKARRVFAPQTQPDRAKRETEPVDPAMVETLAGELRGWASGRDLLFSEENLLGRTRSIRQGVLYGDQHRVQAFAQAIGDAPLNVFLSIRSLDGFLPSAYAEALKTASIPIAEFEKLSQQFLAQDRPWFDLIERLAEIMPQARFRIWNYAHYEANVQRILEEIAGMPLPPIPSTPRPTRTRTPSRAAIEEALTLPEGKSRTDAVRAIFSRDVSDGAPKFAPYDMKMRTDFQIQFARDLAAIKARWPDALMTF